jgi:hypothetical protein
MAAFSQHSGPWPTPLDRNERLGMDPQAYQQLIDRMAGYSGSDLESFFDSHGLGAAYRAPNEGWGKKHRINQALAAARRQGTYDAVLADARRQYGGATPTGEAPWPPARIRFELERLKGDLEAWQPLSTYRRCQAVHLAPQRTPRPPTGERDPCARRLGAD